MTRVDINVPIHNGRITDDTRINRILPTIRDIRSQGGKVVLVSHLGRPGGKYDKNLSLRQLIPKLKDMFGVDIIFVGDIQYHQADVKNEASSFEKIMLLENIRFYPGETSNSQEFCKKLAAWGDVFCNDAFAASHRDHASVSGVAQFLPSCAGRLLEKEYDALSNIVLTPERPVVALVGGSKISTKMAVLTKLCERVDYLVIGGAMANTFLLAQGFNTGKSLVETDFVQSALNILVHAELHDCQVVLPIDVVVSEGLDSTSNVRIIPAGQCLSNEMILDAGPETVSTIGAVLTKCKNAVWNGPIGAFETHPFHKSTLQLARMIAELTNSGNLRSIAGGGDTLAAIAQAGVSDGFSYLSTGGGAFLEFLEGKQLPGFTALGMS